MQFFIDHLKNDTGVDMYENDNSNDFVQSLSNDSNRSKKNNINQSNKLSVHGNQKITKLNSGYIR